VSQSATRDGFAMDKSLYRVYHMHQISNLEACREASTADGDPPSYSTTPKLVNSSNIFELSKRESARDGCTGEKDSSPPHVKDFL
jgi:hypothetical protein